MLAKLLEKYYAPSHTSEVLSRTSEGREVLVFWLPTERGLRGKLQGKFLVPDRRDEKLVCLKHGNLVFETRDTAPGERRGVVVARIRQCDVCEHERKVFADAREASAEIYRALEATPVPELPPMPKVREYSTPDPWGWGMIATDYNVGGESYGIDREGRVRKQVWHLLPESDPETFGMGADDYSTWELVEELPPEVAAWRDAMWPKLAAIKAAREAEARLIAEDRARLREWERVRYSLSPLQQLKLLLERDPSYKIEMHQECWCISKVDAEGKVFLPLAFYEKVVGRSIEYARLQLDLISVEAAQ